jgi:hypothetical protein
MHDKWEKKGQKIYSFNFCLDASYSLMANLKCVQIHLFDR